MSLPITGLYENAFPGRTAGFRSPAPWKEMALMAAVSMRTLQRRFKQARTMVEAPCV